MKPRMLLLVEDELTLRTLRQNKIGISSNRTGCSSTNRRDAEGSMRGRRILAAAQEDKVAAYRFRFG